MHLFNLYLLKVNIIPDIGIMLIFIRVRETDSNYCPHRWEVMILEQGNKLQYTNPECDQAEPWATPV